MEVHGYCDTAEHMSGYIQEMWKEAAVGLTELRLGHLWGHRSSTPAEEARGVCVRVCTYPKPANKHIKILIHFI